MKTERMRSFEKKLLGASEDGIEDDQTKSDDAPTYKGYLE